MKIGVHKNSAKPLDGYFWYENFTFKRFDNSVQLFNLKCNEETGFLAVHECISVDRNLHVRLSHDLFIPLPQWFR